MQFTNASDRAGLLICLEGIDGAGKDTVALNVALRLKARGVAVEQMTFPDYNGPLGSALKYALSEPMFDAAAFQLLFSADRMRQRPQLLGLLDQGKLVLTSRYSWSAVVYGKARGLPTKWLQGLEFLMPSPALSILLDIGPSDSSNRTGRSDWIERSAPLLRRCSEEYRRLATANRWPVVDATDAPGPVAETVISHILTTLRR